MSSFRLLFTFFVCIVDRLWCRHFLPGICESFPAMRRSLHRAQRHTPLHAPRSAIESEYLDHLQAPAVQYVLIEVSISRSDRIHVRNRSQHLYHHSPLLQRNQFRRSWTRDQVPRWGTPIRTIWPSAQNFRSIKMFNAAKKGYFHILLSLHQDMSSMAASPYNCNLTLVKEK